MLSGATFIIFHYFFEELKSLMLFCRFSDASIANRSRLVGKETDYGLVVGFNSRQEHDFFTRHHIHIGSGPI